MSSRGALGIAFGILAIACPAVARASIVYGAPAPGAGLFLANPVPGQTYNNAGYDVDLNGDGHADLMFGGAFQVVPFVNTWRTNVSGASGVQFTEDASSSIGPLARPIDAGTSVGPGTPMGPDSAVTLSDYGYNTPPDGPLTGFNYGNPVWMSPVSHYLGFSFVSADGTHYGWVDLSYENVNAWAYESAPGTPIIVGAVPEPASAALMMLSAPLLLARCRKVRRDWQSC